MSVVPEKVLIHRGYFRWLKKLQGNIFYSLLESYSMEIKYLYHKWNIENTEINEMYRNAFCNDLSSVF